MKPLQLTHRIGQHMTYWPLRECDTVVYWHVCLLVWCWCLLMPVQSNTLQSCWISGFHDGTDRSLADLRSAPTSCDLTCQVTNIVVFSLFCNFICYFKDRNVKGATVTITNYFVTKTQCVLGLLSLSRERALSSPQRSGTTMIFTPFPHLWRDTTHHHLLNNYRDATQLWISSKSWIKRGSKLIYQVNGKIHIFIKPG